MQPRHRSSPRTTEPPVSEPLDWARSPLPEGEETAATCVPATPAACGADVDCAGLGADYLCVSGVCTAPQDQCFDQTQCPVNDKCVEGKCTPACSEDADCAAGHCEPVACITCPCVGQCAP